ncbi:MAG: ABC transporter ATP-binding protein [Clostridia bacterium]
MDAIKVSHVTKAYPGFQLNDVTFELPEGCILGLIGENGAGKSTLIRLLLNLCRADAGEMRLLDVDTRDAAFRRVKEEVGVVLDDAGLPDMLTIKQIRSVMKSTYANWSDAQFDQYVKAFFLPVSKQIKDYSRGTKMKLLIAIALSHGARLLILDEATSGLDPIVRDEILSILSEFTRDERCSILISSHILSDLDKLCDYIAFLHEGKLLLMEEKDALLEKYACLKCGKADFEALEPSAVVGYRASAYGVEALVLREKVPARLPLDKATMEDIMLYIVKGEKLS